MTTNHQPKGKHHLPEEGRSTGSQNLTCTPSEGLGGTENARAGLPNGSDPGQLAGRGLEAAETRLLVTDPAPRPDPLTRRFVTPLPRG
jgi:hypothetical protein